MLPFFTWKKDSSTLFARMPGDGVINGRSRSSRHSVIPQDSRSSDLSFMFWTRKLLAWLIIGNTSPVALPLFGSDVDELSVEIGQATWTPPGTDAKVP
ncbi:hypothetical protein ATY76_01070 [Rhizobium sp. R339]|nr:hypothetical protein ATY76_01070 [Rhizobium sp. R339]